MNSFDSIGDQSQPAPLSHSSRCRWLLFLTLTSGLCLLWLVILPRAAEIPHLHAEIEFLEEKQIDPTAMFYSDHETIEETVGNINAFHKDNPNALW